MSEDQNQISVEHESHANEENILNQDTNRLTNNQDSNTKKPIKVQQIVLEEENKTYFLEFSTIGKNLKILLSEHDIFPARSYEVFLALDELKLKNDLFAIYNSINELSDDLNNPENKFNFNLKKKDGGIIALVIAFLIEEENNDIEIDLNENIIDDREMFRQLYEKYKNIQHEQEEDISHFMYRIKAIEEILTPHKEESEPVPEQGEMQGEEHQNGEEHEHHSENMMKEESNESNKGLIHESLDIRSSNKESTSSVRTGKNVKKGKIEKKKEIKKEEKGKLNKRKKK
jgi:hypothetical protein